MAAVRRRVAAWAAAAALLSGCTVPTQNPMPDLRFQANTPVGALARHVTPLWTSPGAPLGRPVVTGDTVVNIESAGESAAIVARDLHDGHELWRRPAGVGAVTGATRLDPVAVRSGTTTLIAHFTGDANARLALVEARSGKAREFPAPGLSGLHTCRLSSDLCAEQSGRERGIVRIDPATGATSAYTLKQGPLDRVADLGGGVYIARRDNVTRIGRLGEGAWEKPIATWFGRDVELPTTVSWTNHNQTSAELAITLRPKPVTDTDLSVPVSEMRSVVIETHGGQLMWESNGTSLWCPGADGVACAGDLSFVRRDKNSRWVPKGRAIVYHGLASAASDGEWSRTLPALDPVPGPERTTFKVPAGTWVSMVAGQPSIGDPATGETSPLDDSLWGACEARTPVKLGPATVSPVTHRPCSATALSNDPAQFTIAGVIAVAVPQPADSLGEGVPGHYVVTTPQGLAVFR